MGNLSQFIVAFGIGSVRLRKRDDGLGGLGREDSWLGSGKRTKAYGPVSSMSVSCDSLL